MTFLLLPTLAGAQAALTLNDCVQLTLANNHSLQAQRFDLASKESLADGAKGLAGPKITFGASYQWQEDPTGIIVAHGLTTPAIFDDRGKVWGFSLLQNIYDAGKTGALIKYSDDTARLQSYETSSQELNLVGNVVKNFYRILQMNDNIKAQQDTVNALESLSNDTHDKLKLGRVAEVDSLQVEAQFLAEKEKLMRYQNDRDRQVSLLKAAMGVAQSKYIELTGTLNDYDFSIPIVTDLSRNPEIQKASVRKAQSEDSLKSAKADSAMQLSLNGRYNVTAVSRVGVHQDEMWIVMVQANLPVFDGGIIASNIRQTKLQVGKSAESYAQTVSDAEATAYSARLSADSAVVRVDASKASLDRAQEAYRIVELSYRVNKASVTDLLFAQATQTTSQAAYYQAIFDRISAVVDLKIAYGQKVL
ncbi:MAG: TolC family protein [Negativicutes bacterium]|nr:TolC family protein [Negativicutes bacterium]